MSQKFLPSLTISAILNKLNKIQQSLLQSRMPNLHHDKIFDNHLSKGFISRIAF